MPAEDVFLFAKGRVALYAILKAMGIGPGDEVLLPGYTCVVVPSAVAYTGARPVYYDIDPNTYNGDPAKAISQITSPEPPITNHQSPITTNIRAVVIQHTYGVPADNTELLNLCHERGIYVIEDCAHAMGGALNGKPLGTLGDAAFASYQWSKPVALGLGGVARVNNADLLPRLRAVIDDEISEPSLGRTLSITALAGAYRRLMTPRLYWSARAAYHAVGRIGLVAPSSTADELDEPHVMPGGYREGFGRLRTRQLHKAMDKLPAAVAHSNTIADVYEPWCREQGIATQARPAGATPMRLRFPILARDRDKLLETARSERIELGDWFNAPLHPDIRHAPAIGYEQGTCPNAEHVARHVINLPTHTRVSRREATRIQEFLEQNKGLLQ